MCDHKLQKVRDSPVHGVPLLSEEIKAASATEGLNILSQEIVDDGSKAPVNDPTDQLESLEKKDDEESTERSAKSCETGLKVVKNEDGAECSTHVDDPEGIEERIIESGGEELEENFQNELSGQLPKELKDAIILDCFWREEIWEKMMTETDVGMHETASISPR